MNTRIPLAKPVFEADDFAAIQQPLETGWVVQGPHVAAFEATFATYVGAPHAAACSSATTGLHLALAALGIGPGDQVVVPAFTWVATANAAVYCGATPVFADIELDTFNVSPATLAAAWGPAVRACIPVHLFGLPVDPGPLPAGTVVVEDAACGLDARLDGLHVGTRGDCGVFSFHPRKAVTTGEGGMVLAATPELDARIRSLRSHGLMPGPTRNPWEMGEVPHVGFNHRMTDFQGALGVTQMAKAQRLHTARAARAARYRAHLADLDWLRLPAEPTGGTHGWQAFVALYQPETPSITTVDRLHAGRNALMLHLAEHNIETRPGTHAVHLLAWYRDTFHLRPEHLPNAWIADRASIALPLYPTLTDAEQDRVIDAVRTFDPPRRGA